MNKAELTIDSKKYDAYVGMYVLAEVCEQYDLEDVGVLGNNIINFGFKWLPVVMYAGVKYSFEREGKTFDLKLYDFIDYLEDNGLDSKEVVNYLNVFGKSINKHVPKVESDDEGAKKK